MLWELKDNYMSNMTPLLLFSCTMYLVGVVGEDEDESEIGSDVKVGS